MSKEYHSPYPDNPPCWKCGTPMRYLKEAAGKKSALHQFICPECGQKTEKEPYRRTIDENYASIKSYYDSVKTSAKSRNQ